MSKNEHLHDLFAEIYLDAIISIIDTAKASGIPATALAELNTLQTSTAATLNQCEYKF
jgi:hypothetical protein